MVETASWLPITSYGRVVDPELGDKGTPAWIVVDFEV